MSGNTSDNSKRPSGPGPRPPHGHGGPRAMMPGEKSRDFKGTMRKLVAYMSHFKWRLMLVLVFAVGSVAFDIIGPKVLSEATTQIFNGVVAKINGTGAIDFSLVGNILLVTLVIYGVSAVCAWVQSWIMSYVSQQTCYSLRNAIAEKIDRLPFAYFDGDSTGDTLSRITNDVDTLGQSLNQGVTQLITSTIQVVGVVIMMFIINWVMTLIALVMVPLSLVLVMLIVKRSQKYFYAQQNLLGNVNAKAEETFTGHAVVRAFGREDETVKAYVESNDALYEAGWKSQFLSGVMKPAIDFIGNLGYVAVAISGAVFAVQGVITVGDIQAFIQYVKNFTRPVTQLAQVSNVLQQLAAAAERIFEFLALPEMDEEEDGVSDADDAAGAPICNVDFEHVKFGYSENKIIIHDFTAHTSCGQTVAIVGPTGAGKTTIVKLLLRFYELDGGKIEMGGRDISGIPRDILRGYFAMVLQDTWLFKGTIAENIRYGRLDATDEEVMEAAKATGSHHFISTLPGGYDFMVDEEGNNLSLGQRQLLAIARAFLANRQMLILDEATSSVDTRTELHIQQAMDTLMRGRTSFVIAHRLSTIKEADLILVMDHGDIVEQGTHVQLIEHGGFYAELYNSQFADFDESEDEVA